MASRKAPDLEAAIDQSTPPPAKPKKPGPGGKRPGAGRKAGSRNKRTIERERRIQKELTKSLARMPDGEIDEIDAVGCLEWAMRCYLRAADLDKAVSVARDLAPYQRPKISSSEATLPLPADMQPEQDAAPDEPAPEHVITGR